MVILSGDDMYPAALTSVAHEQGAVPPCPASCRPATSALFDLDQLLRRDPPGAGGDRDGRGGRGRRAGGARVRDRADPAGEAGFRPSSTSRCWRRPARSASTVCRGRSSIPRAFRELFPDLNPSDFPFRQPVGGEAVYFLTESRAQRVPTPPTMHNAGFYTASICEIVRWMGERAEGAGVNLFAGLPGRFAADRWQRGARRADHARPASIATASRPATTPSPPTSPRR